MADCQVLPVTDERADSYAYLLGLYLGDGYIAHYRSYWAFRVYLDSRYPAVIARCAAAIGVVNPFHKVGVGHRDNVTIVRSNGRCWTLLFPQHGPGRKHERLISLTEWQTSLVEPRAPQFLRGLIESDGCRFDRVVNGVAYPAYQFTNRSADILALFCWACDLVGVRYSRPSAWNISIARRRDVAIVDEFVGSKL